MKTTKSSILPVLSIAGFDGSGGAGIQADTKTISALGAYAMNVLTALPVQNTQGVRAIFSISPDAIKQQLDAIFDDIYPVAIKIGMVHTTELVHIIAAYLKHYTGYVVFDPVMVSTSGHRLINEETVAACTEMLFPLAHIITPNLDEAAVLLDAPIGTLKEMEQAAIRLLDMGSKAVLVKGGHLDSPILTSVLAQKGKELQFFSSTKIDTLNTHGSGCTLSSAIATLLAQSHNLEKSVEEALSYVHQAILQSKDLVIGHGNGPLNHFFNPIKLQTYAMD